MYFLNSYFEIYYR